MIDLAEMVKSSRRFYREHGLPDWARAIGKGASPGAGCESTLRQAEKIGFISGFAFPPFELQMAQLERLVDETARKPAAGLPDTQQYHAEPFLSDEWSKNANGRVLQRTDDLGVRNQGPYIFLFAPDPPASTWGKTGKQLEELFQSRDWHGLTVPEYFVLQRHLCEMYRDQRFFATPQDEKPTHWVWLLDSMNATNCTVVAGGARGINLQAAKAANRDSRRGTLTGVLLPLENQGS